MVSWKLRRVRPLPWRDDGEVMPLESLGALAFQKSVGGFCVFSNESWHACREVAISLAARPYLAGKNLRLLIV